MDLCQYKDLFGKPREGAHSYRFMDIAVVDVIMTLVVVYLLSLWYGNTKDVRLWGTIEWKRFWCVCITTFLIGILAHKLFCVDTTVNKWIFG
jgi:hypothetical protein